MKLAVTGCQGRMGQRITQLALADSSITLQTLLERADHPQFNESINNVKISSSREDLKGCDVLIDFTAPAATIENIKACRKMGVKMVIGTTGFTDAQVKEIEEASKTIAIVFASNMSVGVNLLFKIAKELATKTPGNYTVKIKEAHHIHKKDAPSGTAKTLAETIEKAGNRKVNDIDSIREGEIIGDHEVVFESEEDTLVISHHAKTRDIFAKGAIIAAQFVNQQTKGLFTMQDVLELN